MRTMRLMMILGTTLLFGVGKISVSYAQEQGTGQVTSDTASERDKPTSKADEPPEANAVAKTSLGTRTGLVGRFVVDQREIWTSPARLRISDTEWLLPLRGVMAGRVAEDS